MNKKMIRRSVLGSMAALAVMAVAGCANEVTQMFTDGTPVEVTALFSDGSRQSLTRAADGLDNSTAGFSLTTAESSSSKVRVMVDANDGTYSPYDYTITNATTITAPATPPTFPSGVNTVNVYGWYPNVSLTNFTVNNNQQSEANYCLSDLMVAVGDACTRSGSSVTHASALSFTHVMSKVKVSLTLASGVTVTQVKLKSILPQVTVTEQKTGNAVTGFNLSAAAGSATDITLLTGGSLTSASAAADKVLCGVFPPQSKNGAFLEITASYNSGAAQTITYSFSSAKTFARANEYTMNISLDGTTVTTGTVDISDWNVESGTVVITPGGGGGTLTLDNTSANLTYGGSNGTVNVTEAGVSTCTAQSADNAIATVSASGTAVTITPVAPGSTQVLVYASKDGSILSSVVNVTVAKGTPSVTAPTYVAGTLTYNGSAQALISAGSSSAGTTMKYATGTSSAATGEWSTSLPSGTNAGTYYVWYKVDGGTNYNDVAATVISGGKEIAKKNPTITLSASALSMNTLNADDNSISISYDGDGALSVASSDETKATASVSAGNLVVHSVGWGSATITVTASAGTNYAAYSANDKTVAVSIVSDPGISLASATVGMVIGANGKAYNTLALANTYSSAAAIIAYKGNGDSNSSYNTGLAISLVDVSQIKAWKSNDGTCTAQNSNIATILSDLQGLTHTATLCSAGHSSHGHAAALAADGYTSTMATPTGCSKWFLPTIGQWNLIVKAMTGNSANLSSTTQNNYYKAAEFNKKIRTAYGVSESTSCVGDVRGDVYLSSVEYNTSSAWGMTFYYGRADYYVKSMKYWVRPVLAF